MKGDWNERCASVRGAGRVRNGRRGLWAAAASRQLLRICPHGILEGWAGLPRGLPKHGILLTHWVACGPAGARGRCRSQTPHQA